MYASRETRFPIERCNIRVGFRVVYRHALRSCFAVLKAKRVPTTTRSRASVLIFVYAHFSVDSNSVLNFIPAAPEITVTGSNAWRLKTPSDMAPTKQPQQHHTVSTMFQLSTNYEELNVIGTGEV